MWMDMEYPYNEMGLHKNEWVIDINNLDESQKHYAEWKKPVLQDYTLHDSINMTISKRQRRSNEDTWLPGTWGEAMEWL